MKDKILTILLILLMIGFVGLIAYALSIPSAESVYIPRSELKELF